MYATLGPSITAVGISSCEDSHVANQLNRWTCSFAEKWRGYTRAPSNQKRRRYAYTEGGGAGEH